MIFIESDAHENHGFTNPVQVDRNEFSRLLQMRICSATHNFRKGSYIKLSTGVLRKVEDMRTEDFIQSAAHSPIHQLAESTVVKINAISLFTNYIAFNYDKNGLQADLEISADHPFFVYGQGWASCNPEMSLKSFGLKCERLQVGDICISLTKQESSNVYQNMNLTEKANNLNAVNYNAAHKINLAHLKYNLDVSNDPATRYGALLNFTWNLFPSRFS